MRRPDRGAARSWIISRVSSCDCFFGCSISSIKRIQNGEMSGENHEQRYLPRTCILLIKVDITAFFGKHKKMFCVGVYLET